MELFFCFSVNPIVEKKIEIKGSDLGFLGTWFSISLLHEVCLKEGPFVECTGQPQGKYSNLRRINKISLLKTLALQKLLKYTSSTPSMYAHVHLGFKPLLSYQGVSSNVLVMCLCAGCRGPGHL